MGGEGGRRARWRALLVSGDLRVKESLVNDKPKGVRQTPTNGSPAPRGEDHIAANLRHLFQGLEQEELPPRFQSLLEELAKKETK